MKSSESHNILTACQHGRRRCETQLITLVLELAKSMDRGRQDLIVLYFSEVFDIVPHQRLIINKFEFNGIRRAAHGWIKAFLTDRSQQVILDGSTSADQRG